MLSSPRRGEASAPAIKISPCPDRSLVLRHMSTRTGFISKAAEMSPDRHSPRYGGMILTKLGVPASVLKSDFDPDPRHTAKNPEMDDWQLRAGFGKPPKYLDGIKAFLEANPPLSRVASPRTPSPRNMSLRGQQISPRTGLLTPRTSSRGIRSFTPRESQRMSLARLAPLEVTDSPIGSPRRPSTRSTTPRHEPRHAVPRTPSNGWFQTESLDSDGMAAVANPNPISPRVRARPICCTYGLDRSFESPAAARAELHVLSRGSPLRTLQPRMPVGRHS